MTCIRNKFIGAASFVGAMALALPASATTIDITNVQVPYGVYGLQLSGGDLASIPGLSDPLGVYLAGQIVLTTNLGIFGTWCVDLNHDIYLGGSYTYVTGALVTNNSAPPGTSTPLTGTQISEIEGLAAYGNATLPGHSDPNDWSAAIQAAIWDVEYFTTVTGGGDAQFYTDLAYIDGLLPGLHGEGYLLSEAGDQSLTAGQRLWWSVPEPMTIALFGAGLLGLGALRRRRRTAC